MERLFLCCFRSCLKGGNDREYYEVLEITDWQRATTDQIKKQYKKLSLTLHPDKLAQKGIEVTADHKSRFLKLKEAYDVLSDAKKRRLYDEYGPLGLKLIENPTEINHVELLQNFQRNHGDRTSLALGIALIFACVLLLPILFSLKCDGTLGDDAPWVAIWSPMWFLDIVLLVASAYILYDDGSKNKDDDEDEDAEYNDRGEKIKKNSDDDKDKIPLSEKLVNLLTTALFVLIQIFVTMRIDKYTHWSWFAVFAPWFAYEAVVILAHTHTAFVTLSPPNHEENPLEVSVEEGQNPDDELFMLKIQRESEHFEKVMNRQRAQKTMIVSALRTWQAVFLAIQIDNGYEWNWGLVFLPIWVYLLVQYLYAVVFRVWGAAKLDGLDPELVMTGQETDPLKLARFQQGNDLMSNAFFLCLAQAVPLFMAIMLVCRLQVSEYSTFLIILPVFLGVGCCCCAVFCGLCCLSVMDTDELSSELAGGASGGGGAAGAGKQQQGDEEQGYAPPAVVVPAGAADECAAGATLNPAFSPPSSAQSESERAEPASDKAHLLPTTTIDADID